MSSETVFTQLGDVINIHDNARIPLSAMERMEMQGDYPYYGATSVMDYVDSFIFSGLHLLLAEDGSVLNDDGTPILQLVDGDFWVNNHAHVLTGSDDIDTRFIFYALSIAYAAPWITGAVQLKLNQRWMKKIEIHFPEKKRRGIIVEQLKKFDDLIHQNEAIANANNEISSALFRSWFIDFDPVKAKAAGKLPQGMDEETATLFPDSFEDSELGPIPTGWKVKSLLEVSELYDNLRVPLSSMEREERKGGYPYHGATSVVDYVDDFIYDGVHLLIAEDGSVVNEEGYPVLQYVWGKFWVNNHAHVLQGKNDVTTEHLHQYVKHFYIRPFLTGAVQLKVNQKALHNVKLAIAPPNINNAFNEIIQSLYRSIRKNKMKNEILTQTRDALLPRLMSGELSV